MRRTSREANLVILAILAFQPSLATAQAGGRVQLGRTAVAAGLITSQGASHSAYAEDKKRQAQRQVTAVGGSAEAALLSAAGQARALPCVALHLAGLEEAQERGCRDRKQACPPC